MLLATTTRTTGSFKIQEVFKRLEFQVLVFRNSLFSRVSNKGWPSKFRQKCIYRGWPLLTWMDEKTEVVTPLALLILLTSSTPQPHTPNIDAILIDIKMVLISFPFWRISHFFTMKTNELLFLLWLERSPAPFCTVADGFRASFASPDYYTNFDVINPVRERGDCILK